jgi:uncharacterized protein (DUF433 family)|uniref:DUF433 domain-containing protein n=1 Tax=uncultured bacterium contig00074 TaxID=1181553 RepID=A0A806K1B3_9BACT|nr:hypothetical protein [uncultured bacterium contig00074]
MENINLKTLIERITLNADVCHGKPTIRNMRYPVDMILDLLASGMSFDEIKEDYPSIEDADILACLAFASRLTQVKTIQRLVV